MTKYYPKGLGGPIRGAEGEIRKKMSDTLVRTIPDQ